MGKPILCLDFDGVIHSYTSGWKGADVIPDPPVPGALGFIFNALEYFNVQVFSSRYNQPGGIQAMKNWMYQYGTEIFAMGPGTDNKPEVPEWLLEVGWPTEKPPAFLTIDDRVVLFTGRWPDVEELRKFKPWNKK